MEKKFLKNLKNTNGKNEPKINDFGSLDHHIHVKLGDDIFTISHDGESIPLTELTHMLTQIAEVCVNKYFRDQPMNKKGK